MFTSHRTSLVLDADALPANRRKTSGLNRISKLFRTELLGGHSRSQTEQHTGVTQSVRLDSIEVEELRNTFVVRAQQLRVHLRRDRCSADFTKAMAGEERDREGQYKYTRNSEFPRAVEQFAHDETSGTFSATAFTHGDGTDLREIFPHDMERAARDYRACVWRINDDEFLHVFVKCHRRLVQQPS